MQKVCENKAVLQTDNYIIAMKMTNVDDSGKLQDRQYNCIHVHDPVITVLQITMLRRIVRRSTHPARLPGLRLPTK
jgi:hypothetical protein